MKTPAIVLATMVCVGTAPAHTAQTGLLVVAHGADSAWNARVREVVTQLAWPHGPAEVAFLMGSEAQTAGWDSAVTRLMRHGARDAVAVPLLVSSFSGHYRQVEYYTGVRDTLEPGLLRHHHVSLVPPPIRFGITPALDSAPELGEVMRDRWEALSAEDRAAPVIFVAHGPNEDAEAALWLAHLQRVAAGVRSAGAPAAQVHLLRDDARAEVRARAVAALRDSVRALAQAHRDSVVVLPLLISSGAITREKIPRDLEGLPARYHPIPLAPHPALARWIHRVAESAMRPGADERTR